MMVLAANMLRAEIPYQTMIVIDRIASLRVQYAPEALGNDVGMANPHPERPFLVLSDDMIGDGQQLEISFDELSHATRHYTYSLVHLNADGKPSKLSPAEYIRGFNTGDITDYEHSFNTSQLYTHYRLLFPNEDMQPAVSGDYALMIYEDANPSNLRAMVRFQVVEPAVRINADLRTNTDIEFAGRYQQLDIRVDMQGLRFTSPEEVTLVVEQNGRSDNRVFNPRPTFIEPQRLTWEHCKPLIFEGGNEYRHIDLSSVYFMGYGVNHIRFDHEENLYEAELFEQEWRNDWPYLSEPDLNGQYVINAERTDADDTEADYMWVTFSLPAPSPMFDGSIYLLGDAWNNLLRLDNRMTYDNNRHAYVCRQLLKQGGYEWQYVFLPKQPDALGQRKGTLLRTEGSHWQTGNTYRIYVYYRPFGARYDRLVGIEER